VRDAQILLFIFVDSFWHFVIDFDVFFAIIGAGTAESSK
jgi:hypothetical protein